MQRKIFSVIFSLLALSWAGYVIQQYFISHPEHMANLKEFKPTTSMLAMCVGLFFALDLVQYFYRDKDEWKFNVTPLWVLVFFGALVVWISSYYLAKSGLADKVDVFTAELNVMFWFTAMTLGLLFFATFFYVQGKAVLGKLAFDAMLEDSLFSIGTGMMTTVAGMFVVGHAQLLYTPVVWFAVIAVLVWRWRTAFAWWGRLVSHKIQIRSRVFSPRKYLFLFLTFVFALNFFDLIRPIPLGWDDMGVYINIPKLISQYHFLLSGGRSFNYFPIISLGFLLFDNATIALYLSYFGGVCAVLAIVAIGRRFFSDKVGITAATVLYLTPMLMWQSATDMKTDPTLLFFLALSVYCFFEWRERVSKEAPLVGATPDVEATRAKKIELEWLVLASLFAGFSFGIKFSATFLIFPMAVAIAGIYLGRTGAAAFFLAFIFVTLKSGTLRLDGILDDAQIATLSRYCALLAVVIGAVAMARAKSRVLEFGLRFGIFVGLSALTFAPWAVSNGFQAKNFHLSAMLKGANANSLSPDLHTSGKTAEECVSPTGLKEEAGRYAGYDSGLDKLIALPWKDTMNTTTHGFWVDIGYTFLAILPALIGLAIWFRGGTIAAGPVVWIERQKEAMAIWFRGETIAAGATVFVWFSFWIFWALRIKLNPFGNLNSISLSPGFAAEIGVMVAMLLAVYWYASVKIRNPLLSLAVFLGSASWVFWMLVSDGIIWYGIGGFLLFALIMDYLIANSPAPVRFVSWVLIFVSLTTFVAFRNQTFGNKSMTGFAFGLFDEAKTIENLAPDYSSIAKEVNDHPETLTEKNYVYRIGTFISYFIVKNDRRLYDDQMLDNFSCMSAGESDEEIYRILKSAGFRYIIIDVNTGTLEKDPNGSLHKKLMRFSSWIEHMAFVGKIKILKNSPGRIAFVELVAP
ncbi:MAG: glycosyltransferase family 39 protein [Nitrospinae bacterium]|nr:glycosyltransferase family 39 protein [Nitrospinota bacterium]